MKITSLFADKPYSAIAIAICFAVLLAYLGCICYPLIRHFICQRIGLR
jgi:mannose/fructose/N-acetylgalactosamine-specific phosphotransferase system component IIC